MDLTEAEGLADLINAETEGQRKQALRQMRVGSTTPHKLLSHCLHKGGIGDILQ